MHKVVRRHTGRYHTCLASDIVIEKRNPPSAIRPF